MNPSGDTPVFRSQDVPKTPGVYVFRNKAGEVIYVGKARNLRNRMRSYFMPSTALKEDPRRRALIHSIASYDIFPVDTESEAFLLEAQFIKQYNPRYNVDLRDDKRYLLVGMNPAEEFPHFFFDRLRKDDNCLYFGPFPHAYALKETIRYLEVRFGLRSCQCASPGEENHHHCLQDVLRECTAPCVGAISREEYGRRVESALSVLRGEEPAREVLRELDEKMREASSRLDFEDAARWRDMMGHIRTVLEPTRRFINQTIARRTSPEVNSAGMEALREALGLDVLPRYMECFDMSNISGTLAVGSMVLFRDGRPSTSEYRRYRIRTPEATDDTAFMREVLTRRYGRLLREGLPLPDLVVLDGGAPQVGCAIGVWEELGLKIPFIGLAKQYELVVIPHRPEPLELPRDNPGLRLLQAIRDEAHRWANGYNRQLRITRIKESVLGEIPGVGERRQAAILKACGSVKRILELTPSQLAAKVPGLGPVLAKSVIETLKQHAAPPRPGTTL